MKRFACFCTFLIALISVLECKGCNICRMRAWRICISWIDYKRNETLKPSSNYIFFNPDHKRCTISLFKMQKVHSINSTVVNASDTSTTSDLIASVVSGHKLNASTNSSKNSLSTALNGSDSQNGTKTVRTNINLKSNRKIAAAAAPTSATATVKPKTAALATSTPAASSNGTSNQPNSVHNNKNKTNNNHNNNNNSSHNNNILMSADIVNLANVLSAQTASIAPDAQAKQVLKEAVDAVVNSFAKHTQGYGRGECFEHFSFFRIYFCMWKQWDIRVKRGQNRDFAYNVSNAHFQLWSVTNESGRSGNHRFGCGRKSGCVSFEIIMRAAWR